MIKINKFCLDRKISETSKVMLINMMNNFTGLRKELYENLTNENEDYYKLANIFCLLFSFFDKISFFLYKHFELVPPNKNEKRVNMNSIWKCSDKKGNKLLDYKNPFLFNLYWMRKEYRDENDLELRSYLLPDAQELSDYRNFLEHKAYSFLENSDLYYIDPELLESRTERLMQLVRNMILSTIGLLDVESKLVNEKTGERDMNLVFLNHQLF
ncbi:LA2681 family HEPN domain-containing protein [Marinilactibacillus psychrotolerans]